MKIVRLALLSALTVAAPACAPRQVEVKTGPQAVSEVSLRVTNNLNDPVNVYVVNGGSDIFLRRVAGKATEVMNVPGIPAGTVVKLKANPVDGSQSYTRDDVTLSGTYDWSVP
jgi:hypothetical protein